MTRAISSLLQYNCVELINIILFKSPWLSEKSGQWRCFNQFVSFCMNLFSLRPSYIPSTLSALLVQAVSLSSS